MTDLLEDLGEDEDALVVEEMEEGESMLFKCQIALESCFILAHNILDPLVPGLIKTFSLSFKQAVFNFFFAWGHSLLFLGKD